MKKLITLALASTTALMLAGCGATDTVAIDTSVMTTGKSNQTGLGGYWFTFVDRTLKSVVIPNTGKTNPLSPTDKALNPGIGQDNGGIVDGGGGDLALHVSGTVIPAPKYSADLGDAVQADGSDWRDVYQDGLFGSLCKDGKCGNIMYPAAGLGFGFKAHNALLGAQEAAGRLGISFRIKLGAGHGLMNGVLNPVGISLPMDLTDVPDASFDDAFGTNFGSGAPQSGVPAVSGVNTPYCTFANTLKADGSVVGGSAKTCYANLATIINPPPTAEWKKYCVTWDAFVAPAWGGSGKSALDAVGITAIIPERLIKMQFDAYKPTDKEPAANFEFFVDDVILLDATNQATICADATPIVSMQAP